MAEKTIATKKQRERRTSESAEDRESRIQKNRVRTSTSRAAILKYKSKSCGNTTLMFAKGQQRGPGQLVLYIII